ncbi:MAG: ATP-dependent helicase, partial [Verrucomicrobia bacterium]|nr:ATP-dependent helicase [Verrucomicrobiota bacterium]
MPATTQAQLLNFRKMKHEFSPQMLREGKVLYEKTGVKEARLVQFGDKTIKISAQVAGAYANAYTCEIEIDRHESEIIDSNCDCPHHYDCLHLACLLFHLEENFEGLVLQHFEGKSRTKSSPEVSQKASGDLKKVLQVAEKKEQEREKREREKQDMQDYLGASQLLGRSAFFVPEEELNKEQGELSFLFVPTGGMPFKQVELQIALRLPFRSKPHIIQMPKQFFSALQGQEPFMLGSNRYIFGIDSFGPLCEELLKSLRQHLQFADAKTDKANKASFLDREGFGEILACAYEMSANSLNLRKDTHPEKEAFSLPGLFWQNFDTPLLFSAKRVDLSFQLQFIREPAARLLLTPQLAIAENDHISVDESILLECTKPGCIWDGLYFRFNPIIKRQHLLEIDPIQKMAIPEYLFGSFVENSLPELQRFALVKNTEAVDQLATLP